MEAIKKKNDKAWAYLDKLEKESWKKTYLENSKCDNIANNNCEAFNAKSLGASLFLAYVKIKYNIKRKMFVANLKMVSRMGPLVPTQQSRLEKEKV